MRPNAARGEEGARVPDSRPSVRRPRKPLGGGGREGPWKQGPSHPRARPRRLQDSPEGRGAGTSARGADPGRFPREPPGPRRGGSPGLGRDPGAPAARTPPASRGGPPRACPCRGRRRGTKKGALASQPGTSRPASRPRPRPQRASGTHARTQKVKSGASPARRRRRPTPAPRPHRGPACAARALPPRSHPGPRPPDAQAPAAAPASRVTFTHTPGTSRVLPPLARLPTRAAAAARLPGRKHRPRLRSPARVSPAGPGAASPGSAAQPHGGQSRDPRQTTASRPGAHLSAGAAGCSLRPPRAPGLVSRALSPGARAPPFSPGDSASSRPPHHPTPPRAQSPARPRLEDARRGLRTPGQRCPHTTTARPAGARLRRAARTKGSGPGGDAAPPARHPRAPRGGAVTSGAVTPSGAGCRRR